MCTAPARMWSAPSRRDLTPDAHAPRSLEAASSRRRTPRGGSLGSFCFCLGGFGLVGVLVGAGILGSAGSFTGLGFEALAAAFAASFTARAAFFVSSLTLFSSRRLALASARSLERSRFTRRRSVSLSCRAFRNRAMASKCVSGGGGGSISTPCVSRTVPTTRILPSGVVRTTRDDWWKILDLTVSAGSSSTSDSDVSLPSVSDDPATECPPSVSVPEFAALFSSMRFLFSARICATRFGSRVSTS